MITMSERAERVRRRYPATIKKMGAGTLYITTHRVVFESEKYGVCLNLHFQWLHEWYPTAKRKVQLSWHEPDPKTNDVRVTDETFGTEIVLERRRDKWKPDAIEFHYSLCFAYTEWTDDDMLQEGWYVGRDGKMRSHYRLAGPKQKTVDQYKDHLKEGAEGWLVRGLHQYETEKEIAKYAKRCTGERLIDQELKWRGVNVEEGTVSLKPRRILVNEHGGRVPTPYEPDYDKLKEYWPDARVPTLDGMYRMWKVEESRRRIDTEAANIKKSLKEGKSYKNSKQHGLDVERLKGWIANHCYHRNLALKLASMQFDTYKQWSTVERAAEMAYRRSGIEKADVAVIDAYEPTIIDIPPAEPYRNKTLEDMQGYRRLLVEAA